MSTETELLREWEVGQALSPAARLSHLAGAAQDMPVGAAMATLLARYRALFGPILRGVVDCPECDTTLDVECDIDALLAAADSPQQTEHSLVLGDGMTVQFRLPTLADLTTIGGAPDEDAAALALLEHCLIDAPALPALLEPVAARMAELDPLGDMELSLRCASCGASFARPLDPAAFLWQETSLRAQRLLEQVAALARAYGWAEADILAMSPIRRQAYLALAGA